MKLEHKTGEWIYLEDDFGNRYYGFSMLEKVKEYIQPPKGTCICLSVDNDQILVFPPKNWDRYDFENMEEWIALIDKMRELDPKTSCDLKLGKKDCSGRFLQE
jgi:hypothetical protein